MRRNLTVFSLSLSLLFVGMVALVFYYPNDMTLSVLGVNLTNLRLTYLGSAAALAFFVLAVMAAFMGGPSRRNSIQEACCCDDHSHVGGCISGVYHDESNGVMVCLNCGTGLKSDFIACPTCGQQIYHECPDCREVIPTWYNVCPYCEYDFVFLEISSAEEEVAAPEPEII